MLALDLVMLEPLVLVTWVVVLAGLPTIAYFTARMLIKPGDRGHDNELGDDHADEGISLEDYVDDEPEDSETDSENAVADETEEEDDGLELRKRDEDLAQLARQKLARMRKEVKSEFAKEFEKLKAELAVSKIRMLAEHSLTDEPAELESEEQRIARAEIVAGLAETVDNFILGWEATKREAWAVALEYHKAALNEVRTVTGLFYLSKVCYKLGFQNDALEHIEEAEALLHARDQAPGWKIYTARGAVFTRLGRYDDAKAQFDKADDLRREQGLPEDPSIVKMRGVLNRAQNRFKDALLDYDKVEKLREEQGLPEDPGIAKNRGVIYDYLGRYEDALEQYGKAEDMRRKQGLPEDIDLAINRGVVFSTMGRYEKALAEYSRAEKLRSERGLQVEPTITFSRALVYFEQGDMEKACELACEARDMYEEHALDEPVHPNILEFIKATFPKHVKQDDTDKPAR